jgi:hypothetical protein
MATSVGRGPYTVTVTVTVTVDGETYASHSQAHATWTSAK